MVGKSVPYGGLAGSMSPKASRWTNRASAFDDQCIIDAVPVASTAAGISILMNAMMSLKDHNRILASRMQNAGPRSLRHWSCHHVDSLVVDLENRGPTSQAVTLGGWRYVSFRPKPIKTGERLRVVMDPGAP